MLPSMTYYLMYSCSLGQIAYDNGAGKDNSFQQLPLCFYCHTFE